MKNLLNDQDPLPKFGDGFYPTPSRAFVYQPPSERQMDEYQAKTAKALGEDWRPYSPGVEINGKGQLRTRGYKPPEPDVVDVCISFKDMAEFCQAALAAIAEPQTQPASQMATGFFELDRLYSKADADGWIPHKPGDPMPCDPEQLVCIKCRDGEALDGGPADDCEWGAMDFSDGEIIAWKPVQG